MREDIVYIYDTKNCSEMFFKHFRFFLQGLVLFYGIFCATIYTLLKDLCPGLYVQGFFLWGDSYGRTIYEIGYILGHF